MQNTTHPDGLDCDGLTLWRGDRCLFSELSFQIGAGAAALIGGPNGSGKTSLLRVVCGLSPPEEGAVHWMGKGIQKQRQAYAKALAYNGHTDGLNAELTPLENLAFFCALRGSEPASSVANLSGLGLDACAGLAGSRFVSWTATPGGVGTCAGSRSSVVGSRRTIHQSGWRGKTLFDGPTAHAFGQRWHGGDCQPSGPRCSGGTAADHYAGRGELSMGRALSAVVRRDLRIAFRRLPDLASPLMFFAIVITLFPLAISPEPTVLREIGPGVLWVAALLANAAGAEYFISVGFR